jgi:hypothetical protein
VQATPPPPDPELELLELDEELLLEELLLEELDEEVDEEPPPETVTVNSCVLWALQSLVYVAVAVHDEAGEIVCSRAVPEVPQPNQSQVPEIGWGPN